MSATNRGAKRAKSDFYATPLECISNFLANTDYIKPGDFILEPSAGNGNIIKALRAAGYDNHVTAVEIRQEEFFTLLKYADKVGVFDFLTEKDLQTFDVIIGNPPYSLAQEFIDKSLSMLKPGGRLIFLLRTNFLESKKRRAWWQDKLPSGLFVCSQRPSFTGKGTDATSYSWFVWEKPLQTDRQTIRII